MAPTTGSALAEMWTNHTEKFTKPLNKPAWMTETSGYVDSWEPSESNPGALGLALDIHAALYYGNIEAWVWWQGSENPGTGEIGLYNLMANTTVGKKYYASKHYYRYLRPGAVRVDATMPYDDVFVTAYQHPERNTQTLIVINSATEQRVFNIEGEHLPESFAVHRTSATENCENIGDYITGSDIILPARTMVTLTTEETVSSINERKIRSDINIYPNPYDSGELNIKLNSGLISKADISFYSVSGSLVKRFQKNVIGGNIKLTPNLEPGIYLLKLESEGQKATKLFCVQ